MFILTRVFFGLLLYGNGRFMTNSTASYFCLLHLCSKWRNLWLTNKGIKITILKVYKMKKISVSELCQITAEFNSSYGPAIYKNNHMNSLTRKMCKIKMSSVSVWMFQYSWRSALKATSRSTSWGCHAEGALSGLQCSRDLLHLKAWPVCGPDFVADLETVQGTKWRDRL